MDMFANILTRCREERPNGLFADVAVVCPGDKGGRVGRKSDELEVGMVPDRDIDLVLDTSH